MPYKEGYRNYNLSRRRNVNWAPSCYCCLCAIVTQAVHRNMFICYDYLQRSQIVMMQLIAFNTKAPPDWRCWCALTALLCSLRASMASKLHFLVIKCSLPIHTSQMLACARLAVCWRSSSTSHTRVKFCLAREESGIRRSRNKERKRNATHWTFIQFLHITTTNRSTNYVYLLTSACFVAARCCWCSRWNAYGQLREQVRSTLEFQLLVADVVPALWSCGSGTVGSPPKFITTKTMLLMRTPQPQLIQNGNTLSAGGDFTSNGPLVAAIALVFLSFSHPTLIDSFDTDSCRQVCDHRYFNTNLLTVARSVWTTWRGMHSYWDDAAEWIVHLGHLAHPSVRPPVHWGFSRIVTEIFLVQSLSFSVATGFRSVLYTFPLNVATT